MLFAQYILAFVSVAAALPASSELDQSEVYQTPPSACCSVPEGYFKKEILECGPSRNNPGDPGPNQWEWSCSRNNVVLLDVTYLPGRANYQIAVHGYSQGDGFSIECTDKDGHHLESIYYYCAKKGPYMAREHLSNVKLFVSGSGGTQTSTCHVTQATPVKVTTFKLNKAFTCLPKN